MDVIVSKTRNPVKKKIALDEQQIWMFRINYEIIET